jgi:hypothetical protein
MLDRVISIWEHWHHQVAVSQCAELLHLPSAVVVHTWSASVQIAAPGGSYIDQFNAPADYGAMHGQVSI